MGFPDEALKKIRGSRLRRADSPFTLTDGMEGERAQRFFPSSIGNLFRAHVNMRPTFLAVTRIPASDDYRNDPRDAQTTQRLER